MMRSGQRSHTAARAAQSGAMGVSPSRRRRAEAAFAAARLRVAKLPAQQESTPTPLLSAVATPQVQHRLYRIIMRPMDAGLSPHVIAIICISILCFAGCQSSVVPRSNEVTLAVINAKIWTGAEQGPREAEALVITGDRIAAVGSNDEIRKRITANTRVVDAGGRRVVPGMTDTHVHTIWAGRMLSQLDLRDVPDRQAFIHAIAKRSRELPPGQWLLGGNWNVESWPDESTPRKEWIDAVTGDRPLFLGRTDGHQSLANSAALKLAGIDRNGPPDPAGGEIERDPQTNEPTGILKDAAESLVSSKIPSPTEAEMYAALCDAMRELNHFGIVAVHDITEVSQLPVLQRASREQAMTIRLTGYLNVSHWDAYHDTVRHFPVHDEWVQLVGFKGFMDGSLGSRTAYMREPFTDATPQSKYPRGLLMSMVQPPAKFREMMRRADAAGFQIAVHAIGDEAIHILLDHYEAIHPHRARIEHSQHILPQDIPRFGKLGVIAVMQPRHKHDDGRFAETAIGHARSETTYAWRSLLESGASVCFGSDWPVATPNPFAGIAAAVTGTTADGTIWISEQNITVEQALRAYTSAGAFAEGREADRGTIETGKLADVVILSQDILTCPPGQIKDTTVTHTIVGGKQVWPVTEKSANDHK
jgi:predicted amidohydrolase YtcJ